MPAYCGVVQTCSKSPAQSPATQKNRIQVTSGRPIISSKQQPIDSNGTSGTSGVPEMPFPIGLLMTQTCTITPSRYHNERKQRADIGKLGEGIDVPQTRWKPNRKTGDPRTDMRRLKPAVHLRKQPGQQTIA